MTKRIFAVVLALVASISVQAEEQSLGRVRVLQGDEAHRELSRTATPVFQGSALKTPDAQSRWSFSRMVLGRWRQPDEHGKPLPAGAK